MPYARKVEMRLLQVLAGIALVAVLGVLAILPYRLYERDIRHATVNAHRISSAIQLAVTHALQSGEDPTGLIERLQGVGDLEIQLTRLLPGEVHPSAGSQRGSSRLDGTELTYVAAPITDRGGDTWLAQMRFDLAPMKRESVRLIIDLCLAVVFGAAIFSTVVFLTVRRSLIVPLRDLTHAVERLHPSERAVRMPEFETQEMTDLVNAVERACAAHHPEG